MTTVYKVLLHSCSAIIPDYEDNYINYKIDIPILNRRVFCFDTLGHAEDFQSILSPHQEIWIANAKDPKPIGEMCSVLNIHLFEKFWSGGLEDRYVRITPPGTLITDYFILRRKIS